MPLNHETAQKLRDVADKLDVILSCSEPVVSYPAKSKEIKRLEEILI